MAQLTDQAYLPRTCTACGGEGEYIVGDWRQGYPKGRCRVCRGTGRMVRDRATGKWTSAPKGARDPRH